MISPIIEKNGFSNHLDECLEFLLNFSSKYYYNSFSKNYLFILEPSGYGYHTEMNDFEKKNLDSIIKKKGKLLTKEEAIELLYIDNMIPNWINISIDKSYKQKTIINILAAREWRSYNKAIKDYPKKEIFHSQVPLPLGYDVEAKNIELLDINKRKPGKMSDFFLRIKRFLKNL